MKIYSKISAIFAIGAMSLTGCAQESASQQQQQRIPASALPPADSEAHALPPLPLQTTGDLPPAATAGTAPTAYAEPETDGIYPYKFDEEEFSENCANPAKACDVHVRLQKEDKGLGMEIDYLRKKFCMYIDLEPKMPDEWCEIKIECRGFKTLQNPRKDGVDYDLAEAVVRKFTPKGVKPYDFRPDGF